MILVEASLPVQRTDVRRADTYLGPEGGGLVIYPTP